MTYLASNDFENRVDKQSDFNAHTSMYVEPAGGLHCRGLLCTRVHETQAD